MSFLNLSVMVFSNTILHCLTSHCSHLVFCSQFKLLLNKSDWNCEKRERELGKERLGCQNKQAEESEAEKEHGKDQEARSNTESKGKPLEGMEGLLDEDGDLEVVRRPRLPDGEARDLAREKVCPIILLKGGNVLEEEEGCCCDVIKIGE